MPIRAASNATTSALLRQLPSRTQINRPESPGRARKNDEVFILTNHRAVLLKRVRPNFQIRSSFQAILENVNGIQPPCAQVKSKLQWQLIVDRYLHEVWRTT